MIFRVLKKIQIIKKFFFFTIISFSLICFGEVSGIVEKDLSGINGQDLNSIKGQDLSKIKVEKDLTSIKDQDLSEIKVEKDLSGINGQNLSEIKVEKDLNSIKSQDLSEIKKEEGSVTEEGSVILESFSSYDEKPWYNSYSPSISFEDYSWFFQKKNTKKKIFFIPFFSYSQDHGTEFFLHFFLYAPQDENYYRSIYFKKTFSKPFIKLKYSYIRKPSTYLKLGNYFKYIEYPDPFYDGFGTFTKKENQKYIHSQKVTFSYNILYQSRSLQYFSYGLETKVFFRKELTSKNYFPTEILFPLNISLSYNLKREEKNRIKNGSYSKINLGCSLSIASNSSFCSAEIDLQLYYHIVGNLSFIGKAFGGNTFFSSRTFSSYYQLSGASALQSFRENRFLGDKIYFLKNNLKLDIFEDFISLISFFELGDVILYDKKFSDLPLFSYGLGIQIPMSKKSKSYLQIILATGVDRFKERSYNFIIDFKHEF